MFWVQMQHGLDCRRIKIHGDIFCTTPATLRLWDVNSTERNYVNMGMLCKTQGQISIAFSPWQSFPLVWNWRYPGLETNHIERWRATAHCSLQFSGLPHAAVSLNSERLPRLWCVKGFSAHRVLSYALTPGVGCAHVRQGEDYCSLDLEARTLSNRTWTVGSQTIRHSWAATRTAVGKVLWVGSQPSMWEAAALSEDCLCPYA